MKQLFINTEATHDYKAKQTTELDLLVHLGCLRLTRTSMEHGRLRGECACFLLSPDCAGRQLKTLEIQSQVNFNAWCYTLLVCC